MRNKYKFLTPYIPLFWIILFFFQRNTKSKKEGYGNPLQLPYRYTKTSTISTNQNSKFRCIPVVGNITNIRPSVKGGSSYRSSMPTILMKNLAGLPTLYCLQAISLIETFSLIHCTSNRKLHILA
jgi:hypothetical protein